MVIIILFRGKSKGRNAS